MTKLWRQTTLGVVCDEVGGVIQTGPFGAQLHESDYSQEGVPVVMPKNIVDGRISTNGIARISPEHVVRLSRHKLQIGDIVYGRRGDIGRQALIRTGQAGWLCGTGCLRLSFGSALVDPLFLHYYLCQDDVVSWISNQAVGSTMPNLNTGILRSVPLRFPPLPTQRRVANILSTYDELIENNQHRIKILETMARALYREWFVHFRYPGHETTPLAPSPLGPIPQGWKIQALGCLGEVITGKTPSKSDSENFGKDIMFVKTPDMHRNMFIIESQDGLTATGAASQSNKMIPAGTICVSCIGTIGVVSITTADCQTNQQINSVVPNSDSLREYLFFRLKDAKKELENLGSNGATMGNVNKGKFEAMEFLHPDADLLKSFHSNVEPMFEEILTLVLKQQKLQNIRDLLLPRLMSGEIDV